ncbi:Unc-89, partial [Cordylochernes scorpioides]
MEIEEQNDANPSQRAGGVVRSVLIKGVQYYGSEPAKLGKTFLRLERDFDMHTRYCRDEPLAQEILAEGPLKEYYDALSKMLHDDKSLSEHLKLPIQRINDYQLLFKELIKYSARMKESTADLEKALDFMKAIPQRMSDLEYINSIQGYTGNIHKLGRIIKHVDPKRITAEKCAYMVKTIIK